MKIAKSDIAKHLAIILGITAILSLCILSPFLPGTYDVLALPISLMVQSFGATGLLLSIVGLLWLAIPKKHFVFALVSLYLSTFIILVLALFAFLSAGRSSGIILLLIWAVVFLYLRTKLNQLKSTSQTKFNFLPIYLILLPIFILIIQLVLAKPLTQWSRNRAIANANEYISDVKDFHTKYGHYPQSIQAMHKDYLPLIAGIEKYHYLQYGDSYNISFEQPRFLFDVFGTREWVVYNPKDEQRAYSHTSWFLLFSPGQFERSQGWYASGITEHSQWKYFLFD